eukprot:354060-Chlamydomonas_euryale.AAC.17
MSKARQTCMPRYPPSCRAALGIAPDPSLTSPAPFSHAGVGPAAHHRADGSVAVPLLPNTWGHNGALLG